MTAPSLPELPQPPYYVALFDDLPRSDAWDEYQLRAYGKQCYEAGREAAAKVCEDLNAFDPDDPGSSAAAAIRKEPT